MPIQLRPTTQALNVHDKGTSVPPWYGDYANKAKWDTDGQPASGPTNGFYNLVTTSATKVQEFIQYGQNTIGWAGTRFIDETVTVTSQTDLSDGSIHVVGNIHIGPIAAYPTDHLTTPVNVNYTVTVNGKVVHQRSGKTGDSYLENANPQDVAFDVTVAPETESVATTMRLDWVYPNHEYPDSHFVLGVALYNPTPPTYVPMAIRKSGSYKSLNKNNGFIRIRHSGSWVNKGEENSNTQKHENTGHNRIRRSSKFLQLPPM